MRDRSLVALFTVLIAPVIFCSCARKHVPFSEPVVTQTPSPPVVREVITVGIVNDVCVLRDDPGADYWIVESSRTAESYMLDNAAKVMEERGYRVDFRMSPFVGSFLQVGGLVEVADKAGDGRHLASPPFYASTAIVHDDEYARALSEVIGLVASQTTGGGKPLVEHEHPDSLPSPDWALLAERIQTDYVLVLAASGVSVSGAKQTGESCLSSCFAAALNAITSVLCSAICSTASSSKATVEVEPLSEEGIQTPSVLKTGAVLFDLRSGRPTWAISVEQVDEDPLSKLFYSWTWISSVMMTVPPAPGG